MTDTGVRVFRAETEPRPSSRPGPVTRTSAWLRGHRVAAGGAAAAAVAAFALWRRHAASQGSGPGDAAAVAGTNGTTVAGLSSPDTETSDIENWVQDALNQQQSDIDAKLAASAPPGNPTTPPTAPKPGGVNGYFRTNPGGTYYKITDGHKWRISAATLKKLQANHTVFHPITAASAAKLPIAGVI